MSLGLYFTFFYLLSEPLSPRSRWLHPEAINPLILLFRDKSWEGPYTKEPDPLFRFYILANFVVLLAMGVILLLTEKQ